MAVSRTNSNCAELRNVGILIMLIWVIKISIVEGICSEPDINALPTDSRCPRPLMKMRLCGTRTPTVCAMPQNVTQVFHKYGVVGASMMTELNTVERCVNGCAGDSSCYAVDWNTASEECWFHGFGTFCNTRKDVYDVDHYKMQKCSSGWRCSKECRYGSCLKQLWFPNQRCVCHVGYTGDTCTSAIGTTCPDPARGENTKAHLQSQAYNIGDVKQYTCIQGHFLENNSTSKAILCQIDGTWNDTAAQCKPGNCTPPDVGNSATTSKVPPYHVHQNVDFECPTGHVFPDGTSVKIITCKNNLIFNATIPNCSRVQCQLPMNLVHMKLRDSGPRLYEDHVHLDCDNGYVLPDNNQTSISLVCMANGSFNQTIFLACEPRPCPLPTHDQNITVEGSAGFRYPDSRSYRCPKGYLFPGKQGEITVACQADGTPSRDSVPSCSPVECTDIGSLTGNLSVSPTGTHLYGSKVNVTCPDGYNMGNDTRYVLLSCGHDGTWGQIPDCFKASGQIADRMTGQPENIAAISAGGGTVAVVVIVVVVGFGLMYWRRRGKEKNESSRDHKNQTPSSHRPSNVNNDTQDVSETGFSNAAVSYPNASDDFKLHMKAKEQESTIADLYAVPERKKKARACTASDTAGDSVQNPSDLYAVPERKKKKNAPPSAIQGTSEADSDDYQLATHFGDDVSDDDMQMVENDLYEDSDGRPPGVTGVGEPPSEGVVFRENSIYGS